jgi:Cu+-exporting ATPase
MKNLIIFLIALFLFSCQANSNKDNKEMEAENQIVELVSDTLNIGGMHCDMCVASIEKGVNELEGIEFVQANLSDSTTVVKYDSNSLGLDEIENAIEKRGYSVKK